MRPVAHVDIHAASPAERDQAFRNSHDVWGRGLSPEDHLRFRQTYAKHQNAQWYVGCIDGRVVTGCGCYPIELTIDGRVEPAFALGEVHTLSEFRGLGLAPRLVAEVERDQHALGKTVAVLYSDIAPGYYEKLGYRLCDCREGWGDPSAADAPQGAGAASIRLVRVECEREWPSLARIYERSHAPLSLWIARSEAYWRHLISRNPEDEYYHLVEPGGSPLGYVRAAATPAELKIRDFSWIGSADALAEAMRSMIRLGRERGVARVGGWMPDAVPWRAYFAIAPRTRELTMIKPLVPGIELGAAHRDAAQYLHEIDHV